MSFRELILAVQFLTRLPTPRLRNFQPDELPRCAIHFPLVGLIIGALLVLPLLALDARPWLAAVLALLVWVWVTGALHIDGLGDVADALGAAHRSPERFLEVLKDPHIGVFGAVAIILQLLLKLVLLAEVMATAHPPWAIVLIPAWARWGTLWWSRQLPSLHPGMGERFSWTPGVAAIGGWALALGALSLWLAPVLLLALPLTLLITAYWRRRLGGISGDCLGASTEVTETALLLALVLVPAAI